MSKSDTPRTDAQTTGNSDPQQDEYEDLLCFTRMLERELTAARAEIKDLHKAYGFELRDPNGTIWEYAAKMKEEITAARAELTAVTEQRDGLRSGIDYASDQLHKVTEQRDRLAEALWNMLNQEHGSAIKAGILLRSLNLQYLNPNTPDQERKSPASDGSGITL
jgi:DNA repair exonuclease SbcCD ATPase subunit